MSLGPDLRRKILEARNSVVEGTQNRILSCFFFLAINAIYEHMRKSGMGFGDGGNGGAKILKTIQAPDFMPRGAPSPLDINTCTGTTYARTVA